MNGIVITVFIHVFFFHFSLYEMFPARVPATNTTEYFRIKDNVDVSFGLGRTGIQQGGFQIVALVVTLAIAVVGGLLTGKIFIIL